MKSLDYVILAVIILWFVLAVRSIWKRRGRCCGCEGCKTAEENLMRLKKQKKESGACRGCAACQKQTMGTGNARESLCCSKKNCR